MLASLANAEALSALLSVVLIDVALAGDNAIVVGMAAAGLPACHRHRAIVAGVAAAAVLRIAFACVTVELLHVVGLLLTGGLLLLWVCWKLWRELQAEHASAEAQAEALLEDGVSAAPVEKSFASAVGQIIVADVSMSLDNVLAVAGAARQHATILIIGLTLSVALMGFAATLVARLLQRHRWIAYGGLAIILYVALRMIWEGGHQVWNAI